MPTVAQRRRRLQLDPVDRDLERRIDSVIASFVCAPDAESRISAWHAFLALRHQRSVAHIEALEQERRERILGAAGADHETAGSTLGDLLTAALLPGSTT